MKRNKILILGIGRSGTTLLASMLGGHPDISILDESDHIDCLVGTKYVGMKWPLGGGQIRWDKKRSVFGSLINRIVNFGSKRQLYRPYPRCKYSIKDFDGKIIFIRRWNTDIINSCMRRGKMSKKQAKKIYDIGALEASKMKNINFYRLDYDDLVQNPFREMKRVCRFLEIEYSDNMLLAAKYNARYGKEL